MLRTYEKNKSFLKEKKIRFVTALNLIKGQTIKKKENFLKIEKKIRQIYVRVRVCELGIQLPGFGKHAVW